MSKVVYNPLATEEMQLVTTADDLVGDFQPLEDQELSKADDVVFESVQTDTLKSNRENHITSEDNLTVPDEAYGSGWNGSLEVPTKNALYDKIETLSAGGLSQAQVLARTLGA